MERQEWKFAYGADKLFAAAKTKCDHHVKRYAIWKEAQDRTIIDIKAHGIEVDEGVNIMESSFSNRRQGPGVQIDNELMGHLNEATQKVVEHRTKAEEYDAWAQVFESQGQSTLELNHDDWIYFFGRPMEDVEPKQAARAA